LWRPQWRVLIDAIRASIGNVPTLTSEQKKRVVRAVLRP
jgi:hypothetical protein